MPDFKVYEGGLSEIEDRLAMAEARAEVNAARADKAEKDVAQLSRENAVLIRVLGVYRMLYAQRLLVDFLVFCFGVVAGMFLLRLAVALEMLS